MIYTEHLICGGCRTKISTDFGLELNKPKIEAYNENYCRAAAQGWYLKRGEVCFCSNSRFKGSGNNLVDQIIAEILMEENV